MKLFFYTQKEGKILKIQLKQGNKIIEEKYLTLDKDFDIILIKTIDKIIKNNKINKLSLKKAKIIGKINPEAMFGMILNSIVKAIGIFL
jgi:hypothetical protein